MQTLREVGIYKDTKKPSTYVLVLKTNESTSYFPFDANTFLKGWFTEKPYPETKHLYPTKYQMSYGAVMAIQSETQRPLHPLALQAFSEYSITPTLIDGCGRTNAHRIKWVRPKKVRKHLE